jgi:hypothetical protein
VKDRQDLVELGREALAPLVAEAREGSPP